jgi:ABC-type uncharacterized transport system substrate-binding protein
MWSVQWGNTKTLFQATGSPNRFAAVSASTTHKSPQAAQGCGSVHCNRHSALPASPQELDDAARARGVALSIFRVTKEDEIPGALDAVRKSGAAALNVLASSLLFSARKTIIPQVAALRLPAIYQWPEITAEGGLIGYGPHITQIYGEILSRQFAALLRGTNPADIPAERPPGHHGQGERKAPAVQIASHAPARFSEAKRPSGS